MPYFVRIGAERGNKSGVGSRGYHLQRRGRSILARWGGVRVNNRQFTWSSYPQEKLYKYRTESDAKSDLLRRIRERERRYSRLPAGQSIR